VLTQIQVTSAGVAVPIRFVVRLVGSVPMSGGAACSGRGTAGFVERQVRRLCGGPQQAADTDSPPPTPPSDVVHYWPTVSRDVLRAYALTLRIPRTVYRYF